LKKVFPKPLSKTLTGKIFEDKFSKKILKIFLKKVFSKPLSKTLTKKRAKRSFL